MTSPQQERTRTGARSPIVVALVVAVVVGAVLGYRAVAARSAATGPPAAVGTGAATIADGVVPGGATVFDDDVPAVGRLDDELLAARRRAASDAAGDGIRFTVNSGWRSPAYQQQLLREAVAEHGSADEAARWVATPETSAHVSGDGVDIGPTDAMYWLAQHGADHGLCQIYGNEPWHYELRPDAVNEGCPRVFTDPTEDPRMHR